MRTPDRILRSRRKTISIEITGDGEFLVRAPQHAPEEEILRFVAEKQDWIMQKLSLTQRSIGRAQEITAAPDSRVPFLGQMLRLKLHERKAMQLTETADLQERALQARGGFAENDRSVLLLPSPRMRTAGISFVEEAIPLDVLCLQNRELLVQWYKKQAAAILRARTEYYAARMGLSFDHVRISSARTNWGSCNARHGINYTWLLVTLSFYEIDYVVVHELAHIRHRDHSSAFYAEVGRILPDYERRIAAMKQDQWVLEIWPPKAQR